MSSEQLIRNLETPRGTLDAILNTDAYNEVDDQFALAYMLLSRERIRTLGICVAPFLNRKRTSPADGMRKNHEEILQVLELMEQTPKPTVYMSEERFLVGEVGGCWVSFRRIHRAGGVAVHARKSAVSRCHRRYYQHCLSCPVIHRGGAGECSGGKLIEESWK